jgi:hypothetical protein
MIKMVKVEIDYGDKRSYGEFELEAETSLGPLKGEGMINSGGEAEDQDWTLNGEPVDENADLPDLGIPHAYAGSRAISRFEQNRDAELAETLTKWLEEYEVFLKETAEG